MMSPLDARLRFPWLLGRLLIYATETAGISVQMGECYRTPEQAAWNAAHGSGIVHSLHPERLAVDLLCFRQEQQGLWVWLKDGTEPEYKVLGVYWKSLHPDCRWGGDFTRPDAGHFSVAIDGRA